jgi:hypothetical protein
MTAPQKVFVSLVEVKPLPGCRLDPSEYAGAYVRCYVAAKSADAAMSRVKKELAGDRFKCVAIDWCVSFDEVDWEKPHSRLAARAVAQARRDDVVVYSDFEGWGPEGE